MTLHATPVMPKTPQELADALAAAVSQKRTITLTGASSKHLMAGPITPAGVSLSTAAMTRVLQYEPRDLTISLEAGMRYADLDRLLAQNRQMIPLDPPFSETATIGGILASNTSGSRRRLYGTARDLVIGMKFATLEGKLVQSGGMVVKNVAGLDMSKIMIGSFGTLAAIAVANFKLVPRPSAEASFVIPFDSLDDAIAARDRILKGQIPPVSIDLLNLLASAQLGYKGHLLALRVAGNAAAVDRCRRELATRDALVLEGKEESRFWKQVQEYTPHFLEKFTTGTVVRASCTLAQLKEVLSSFETAAIARAGSGVCYAYFTRADAAVRWLTSATRRGWKATIEFAPDDQRARLDLWPAPGAELEMMKKIKNMFDPNHLLNRGRLFRLI
ncbi:MAG TPA: FAD-binding oxidoreductase [Bryobacteraceae bacterium]|nr:FAD-binding oxidoreductase [Bryobacteraceae bacterium]